MECGDESLHTTFMETFWFIIEMPFLFFKWGLIFSAWVTLLWMIGNFWENRKDDIS